MSNETRNAGILGSCHSFQEGSEYGRVYILASHFLLAFFLQRNLCHNVVNRDDTRQIVQSPVLCFCRRRDYIAQAALVLMIPWSQLSD